MNPLIILLMILCLPCTLACLPCIILFAIAGGFDDKPKNPQQIKK